jgi:hypothetical protein
VKICWYLLGCPYTFLLAVSLYKALRELDWAREFSLIVVSVTGMYCSIYLAGKKNHMNTLISVMERVIVVGIILVLYFLIVSLN